MDTVLRHVVQDEVKEAIDALPETFRLPVMLADLADCSYQEIADIAECPVNTVKTRMFHARRRLKVLLPKLAGDQSETRRGRV